MTSPHSRRPHIFVIVVALVVISCVRSSVSSLSPDGEAACYHAPYSLAYPLGSDARADLRQMYDTMPPVGAWLVLHPPYDSAGLTLRRAESFDAWYRGQSGFWQKGPDSVTVHVHDVFNSSTLNFRVRQSVVSGNGISRYDVQKVDSVGQPYALADTWRLTMLPIPCSRVSWRYSHDSA